MTLARIAFFILAATGAPQPRTRHRGPRLAIGAKAP